MMTDLLGQDPQSLKDIFTAMGLPDKKTAMRADQLFRAIYIQGVRCIDEITTLSKDLREDIKGQYHLDRLEIVQCQTSKDGTIKWLLKTKDKQLVETVFIPEKDRGTLCISSQVGCTLNCTFCHTGTQRLVKNLSPAEIIGQIMIAKDHLNEWEAPSEVRKFTNIVLMGMGEPLYNYDNVKQAMQIIMHPKGMGFGKRRITLSTSGIVPFIEKTGDELGVNLAISLHAVHDELRDEIVPINKKYPLKMLLEACKNYPTASNSRRITFEYVMLKDVNDSLEAARSLVTLLRNIPAKINLIPFNPWPGSGYKCSSPQQIRKFADIIQNAGYPSPIRTPRGQDILAACGQLKSASEKQKASTLKNKVEA